MAPRIDIEPDVALVDETVALRVTGLPAHQATVNHARHPVATLDFAFGGSPAAEAFARADSWPRVVAFLRRARVT